MSCQEAGVTLCSSWWKPAGRRAIGTSVPQERRIFHSLVLLYILSVLKCDCKWATFVLISFSCWYSVKSFLIRGKKKQDVTACDRSAHVSITLRGPARPPSFAIWSFALCIRSKCKYGGLRDIIACCSCCHCLWEPAGHGDSIICGQSGLATCSLCEEW